MDGEVVKKMEAQIEREGGRGAVIKLKTDVALVDLGGPEGGPVSGTGSSEGVGLLMK